MKPHFTRTFLQTMKNIKRPFGYILTALIGSLLAVTACSRKETANVPLTVSALLPLTGDFAFLGEPGKVALDLASKKLAGESVPVRFETQDTKANPKDTVTLVRREMDVAGRRVFLVTLSGPSMAAKEALAKSDALLLSVSIHPELPSTNAPVVRFCLSAAQEGKMLAQKITEFPGSVGLVVSRDAASTFEIEKIIQPLLVAAGRPPVFVEWFDVGNKDFKNLAARLRDTKPGAILLLGYGSDFPPALEAVAISGHADGLKVFGGIGFVELGSRPKGLEKTSFDVVVPGFVLGGGNVEAETFRAAYRSATGKPAPYDAAFTYDAALTLGSLVKQGIREPQALLQALRGHSFEGVTGKIEIASDGEATTDLRWATLGESGLAPSSK